MYRLVCRLIYIYIYTSRSVCSDRGKDLKSANAWRFVVAFPGRACCCSVLYVELRDVRRQQHQQQRISPVAAAVNSFSAATAAPNDLSSSSSSELLQQPLQRQQHQLFRSFWLRSLYRLLRAAPLFAAAADICWHVGHVQRYSGSRRWSSPRRQQLLPCHRSNSRINLRVTWTQEHCHTQQLCSTQAEVQSALHPPIHIYVCIYVSIVCVYASVDIAHSMSIAVSINLSLYLLFYLYICLAIYVSVCTCLCKAAQIAACTHVVYRHPSQ